MVGVLRHLECRRRLMGQEFKTTYGPDLIRTKFEFSLVVQLLRISEKEKVKNRK